MSWLLLFIKIKTVAAQIAAFVIARWRVFLPLAMVVLGLWYVYSLRDQRDDAVHALAEYKRQEVDATEKRRLVNQAKDIQSIRFINDERQRHTHQINQLRKEYEALRKNDKAAADRTIAQLRNSLREQVASLASHGLPELPQAIEGAAGSGRDCDAAAVRQAYATLELACAVTTADYNSLRAEWDGACEVYGCK